MERQLPTTGQPVKFLWETPHYGIVKTVLPKENGGQGLPVFAVIDKEHGIVWGARTGLGGAKVAACEAEQEWVSGQAIADALTVRGFPKPVVQEAGSGDELSVPKFN